ncbi:MAG TPA: TetR/AcrR family transcriptional regulator [Candidatus Cloacimonadota bacterium]|nr:TetR/AcrR family transcriptional regulator [Candidatus Cloacimonadota bacterium]HPT72245.1 TetR/AcrR family transcriptional regulator [Candidatus Cloacimonadota bacterium]
MGTAERKQREKELRKKQILKAAEKIITRKGMLSTTMEEIAESCELSKGTIYLYFKNKEELNLSILIMVLENFTRIMEKNLKKLNTFEERLRSIGESYLEFYKNYPGDFKIMNHNPEQHPEIEHSSRELERDLLATSSKLWGVVENVIREGMDLGLIRKDIDPLEIGISLWASSNGMIQIMEHIRSDAQRGVHEKSNIEEMDEYSRRFMGMDFEQMLRNLWAAVNNSILVKPAY